MFNIPVTSLFLVQLYKNSAAVTWGLFKDKILNTSYSSADVPTPLFSPLTKQLGVLPLFFSPTDFQLTYLKAKRLIFYICEF